MKRHSVTGTMLLLTVGMVAQQKNRPATEWIRRNNKPAGLITGNGRLAAMVQLNEATILTRHPHHRIVNSQAPVIPAIRKHTFDNQWTASQSATTPFHITDYNPAKTAGNTYGIIFKTK